MTESEFNRLIDDMDASIVRLGTKHDATPMHMATCLVSAAARCVRLVEDPARRPLVTATLTTLLVDQSATRH